MTVWEGGTGWVGGWGMVGYGGGCASNFKDFLTTIINV
jgi:hypothetical protein